MLLSVSKGNLAVRERTANLANLPRIGISVTDDFWEVVGASGFEPPTSCSRTRKRRNLGRRPDVTYGSRLALK